MTLSEIRTAAKLDQAVVAKRLDVDQSAVSHWERGKWPPLKKYRRKMARMYGVTVDVLDEIIQETMGGNGDG